MSKYVVIRGVEIESGVEMEDGQVTSFSSDPLEPLTIMHETHVSRLAEKLGLTELELIATLALNDNREQIE